MAFKHTLVALVVTLCLTYSNAAFAADRAVIKNVRVFDGEKVLPKADVVIDNGVIESVSAAGDQPIPEGIDPLTVIDGQGMTLLPGLIDGHFHTDGQLAGLQASIRMGVTSLFDTYTPEDKLQTLRAAAASAPQASYADFWSAGQAGNVPNGHGTRDPKADSIKNIKDIDRWLSNRIAAKVDYIKLVAETGFFPGMKTQSMDARMLKVATEAIHRKGLRVIAHASEQKTAIWAIDAGVDILAHPWSGGATPEMIAKLKSRNITVMATIGVYEGMYSTAGPRSIIQDPRLRAELNDTGLRALTETFELPPSPRNGPELLALVGTLHKAGIRIIAGTDAINSFVWPGVSMHRELELLVESGLTPIDALHAATAAVADTFGKNDRGRIAPGKRADLLLVAGDPTTNIRDSRNIIAIWKAGQRVDRSGSPPVISVE